MTQHREFERDPLFAGLHRHLDEYGSSVDASCIQCIHEFAPSAVFHKFDLDVAVFLLEKLFGFKERQSVSDRQYTL